MYMRLAKKLKGITHSDAEVTLLVQSETSEIGLGPGGNLSLDQQEEDRVASILSPQFSGVNRSRI